MFKGNDEEITKLLEEIRGLRGDLRKAREQRDEAHDQLTAEKDLIALKKQITDMQIEKDRLTEAHEREKREVKHMVGLERKRQEFEVAQAKRETTVTVREENLAADRKRFEEQMAFTTERFEKEVGYLKDLMGEVLDRLPTVTIDRTVTNGSRPKATAQ